ncbi:hypothetical protein D3C71_137120 [compost metagenome]
MLIILFSPTKKINQNNFISDGTFANNVFCFNIIIKFFMMNIESAINKDSNITFTTLHIFFIKISCFSAFINFYINA